MPTGIYERRPRALTDPLPRFWKKVRKTAGCWEWIGGLRRGYGRFWYKNKNWPAHRFILEVVKGPLAPEVFACHTCDNPICVRPDHLFPGTVLDNVQDSMKKGRWGDRHGVLQPKLRGSQHHQSKLKESDVVEILDLYRSGAMGMHKIAKAYKVSKYTIFCLLHGITWKYFTSTLKL